MLSRDSFWTPSGDCLETPHHGGNTTGSTGCGTQDEQRLHHPALTFARVEQAKPKAIAADDSGLRMNADAAVERNGAGEAFDYKILRE